MKLRFLSIVACLLLISGTQQFGFLHAQNNAGTIEGTVNDTAGRPLTDVTVQLTNPATDQKWTTATDSNGFYRFANLPVGRYRITTGAAGQPGAPAAPPAPAPGAPVTAAPLPAQEYEATAGGPVVVNLTVATPSTDHIISAEAVPIRTNPAAIQHVYNTEDAQYWPRSNWMSKTSQLHGTYNDILISEAVTSGDVLTAGPAVAGQPPFGDNFRTDGVDNNNKVFPGPLVYISNFATESTNFFQNQAVPIFGHSIGGQTDLVMQSGTNQVHGAIYDFIQASQLNAEDQAAAREGFRSIPSFTQNRLGASLGLPIVKNKVFFFGNFEYIPLNAKILPSGSMLTPTAAGFATLSGIGGISGSNLALLRSLAPAATTQTTTTTIGGRSIPMGFAAPLLNDHTRSYMGTGGVDVTLRAKDNLHVRYVHNLINGNTLGQSNFSSVLPLFQTPQSLTALLADVSETHSFASGPINELRLSYNRWSQSITPPGNLLSGFSGFPSIGISGDTNMLLGPPNIPFNSAFNTYQVSDVFSVNRGRHRADIGMDALRYIGALTNFPSFNGGMYGYSNLGLFLFDLPPDVMAFRGFGTGRVDNTRYLFEWFAQDRFQFRPNTQLTLGVRYQYNTIPQSLQAQRLNAIASVPGVINFAEPSTQKSAVAPYFGIAWSPAGSTKTVVRGGFSMHYQSLYDTQLLTPFTTFSPQVGTLIAGTNLGSTGNFLTSGGLKAPATPNQGINQSQARSLTSAFTPNDQVLPYNMQWQLAVQRAFWNGFTAELKYIGSRDVDLPFINALNTPFGTGGAAGTATGLTAQGRALNAAGFTNPIFTVSQSGLSRYNAAAVNLNQRLSGGLQFLANYTWSHNYANTTGTMNDLIFGRQLADTLWDRRHRASIGFVYDVGSAFKNTNSVVRNIFANFAFSGGYIYEWPARLPVVDLTGNNINGLGVSPTVFTGNGSSVNPSGQFTAIAPGSPGAARQAISLSPVNNLNVSVSKRFSYKDRAAFEIRGDAFNVANHPQYTYAPITGLNSSSFGLIPGFTTGSSPVVPSIMTAGSPSFFDPSQFFSSNPRVLQLSLRMTW